MAGLGPRVLQVLEFASVRAPELQALHEISQHAPLSSPTDAKLQTQKNQRRRRANAFKSHQMPHRLRSKPKTPSKDTNRCRKHERRVHKLMELRTAVNCERPRWLSSHLWHAKRMKMVERFGYVLAARRADKNVSAALQALCKTAVVHDASYYGVIELFGLPQVILEALQLVSDPNGSDFHGLRFLAGQEEGRSMLYQEGQFPSGAIAPVTFMWRPLHADYVEEFKLHEDWQTTKRQLWLWVHPAAYMEAATAIASACQAVAGEEEAVEMLDRRGQLCRLKLRGKLADGLVEALAGCESGESFEVQDDGDSDHEDDFNVKDIVDKCRGVNRKKLLNALRNQEKEMEKDAVYAVAIKDPRLARWKDGKLCHPRAVSESGFSLLHEPQAEFVPEVGTNVIESPLSGLSLSSLGKDAEEPETKRILEEMQALLAWTTGSAVAGDEIAGATYPRTNASGDKIELKDKDESAMEVETSPSSLLWSFSKRQELESNFMKDTTLNDELYQQRKEGMLVNDPKKYVNGQPLHLLVIQKSEPYPHTSGWDLVCTPASVPGLLKALAFGGALVVGLEEDAALSTVLHQPSFPCDYPDTQAGQAYWETRAQDLDMEQAKKPKSKRVNFEKLGVTSPFQPMWKLLFDHQKPETDTEDAALEALCVLRGEKYMEPFNFYLPKSKEVEDEAMTSSAPDTASIIPVPIPTIVRVVVVVPRRGNIDANAMLFAPSAEDQEMFYKDKDWKGYDIDLNKKSTKKKTTDNKPSLIGFVTSAIYDRPKGAFRAVGFIACEPLQQLFLVSQGCNKQSNSALAMLRSPRSRMVRPVLVQVAM